MQILEHFDGNFFRNTNEIPSKVYGDVQNPNIFRNPGIAKVATDYTAIVDSEQVQYYKESLENLADA